MPKNRVDWILDNSLVCMVINVPIYTEALEGIKCFDVVECLGERCHELKSCSPKFTPYVLRFLT